MSIKRTRPRSGRIISPIRRPPAGLLEVLGSAEGARPGQGRLQDCQSGARRKRTVPEGEDVASCPGRERHRADVQVEGGCSGPAEAGTTYLGGGLCTLYRLQPTPGKAQGARDFNLKSGRGGAQKYTINWSSTAMAIMLAISNTMFYSAWHEATVRSAD